MSAKPVASEPEIRSLDKNPNLPVESVPVETKGACSFCACARKSMHAFAIACACACAHVHVHVHI